MSKTRAGTCPVFVSNRRLLFRRNILLWPWSGAWPAVWTRTRGVPAPAGPYCDVNIARATSSQSSRSSPLRTPATPRLIFFVAARSTWRHIFRLYSRTHQISMLIDRFWIATQMGGQSRAELHFGRRSRNSTRPWLFLSLMIERLLAGFHQISSWQLRSIGRRRVGQQEREMNFRFRRF
jgi:hypothetical protein